MPSGVSGTVEEMLETSMADAKRRMRECTVVRLTSERAAAHRRPARTWTLPTSPEIDARRTATRFTRRGRL